VSEDKEKINCRKQQQLNNQKNEKYKHKRTVITEEKGRKAKERKGKER
jgi:hypothetical protein